MLDRHPSVIAYRNARGLVRLVVVVPIRHNRQVQKMHAVAAARRSCRATGEPPESGAVDR